MKNTYYKTSFIELKEGLKFKKYKITEIIISFGTNLSFVKCYDEIFEEYCYFIFFKKEVWYYRKLLTSDFFRKEVKALSNEELMDIE